MATTASVILVEPGPAVPSSFGHALLWLRDEQGITTAYSFGGSDPAQEGFWSNVLRAGMPSDFRRTAGVDRLSLVRLAEENRGVRALELNLASGRVEQLSRLLNGDPRGESSLIYEFYRDNCTTAIRDLIDWAVDGQIWDATSDVYTERTLRWHTERYTLRRPGLHTSLAALMGQPVDRPITRWEEMFLPETLADGFRQLTIRDEGGNEVPLVRSEQVWFESTREPVPAAPEPVWLGYLGTGLLVGGLLGLSGHVSARQRWSGVLFTVVAISALLAAGTLGALMGALATLTNQYVAFRNENLLQLHPGLLLLAVTLVLGALGVRSSLRLSRRLALVFLLISVLGLLLKATPWFFQDNWAVLAVMVPIHFGLAYGSSRWEPHVNRTGFNGD